MHAIAQLPLSRVTDMNSTLLWLDGQPITLGRFISQARVLAQQLPTRARVIVLCNTPQLFMLAFVAALLREHTSLLPPNRLAHTLTYLARNYSDCYVLADHADDALSATQAGLPHRLLSEQDLSVSNVDTEHMPSLPGALLAAVLFTSGSTGESQAIHKHWHTLVRGAAANARASLNYTLDLNTTLPANQGPDIVVPAIVGTVPCQHSYGLETMIMLPLQGYASVAGERPFYPSDVQRVLTAVPAPRVLVTTPVHLRALTEAGSALPSLNAIWSATAPLSVDLATRAEQLFHAPMHEIFGCTEVGTCATRRTTHTDIWTLLPEFALQPQSDQAPAQLSAAHVEQSYPLQDHVELLDAMHFRLLGRGADMLNIAGKRASLTDLNQRLLSIPGVIDGVIFLPDAANSAEAGLQRTAALVVAPTLDREQVFAALRELIEPAFLPRPLFLVPALPRNEVAKLPRHALLNLLAQLEHAHG